MKIGNKVKINLSQYSDSQWMKDKKKYYHGKEGVVIGVNKKSTYPVTVNVPGPDGECDYSIWKEEELDIVE